MIESLETAQLLKCIHCAQFLAMDNFYRDKKMRSGYRSNCKTCQNEQTSNRTTVIKQDEPWLMTLKYIKDRCNNPNRKEWKDYGGRNIECRITGDDLKKLWFRDRADLMKKASIDRIDPDDHYRFDNCRYVELAQNASRRRNPGEVNESKS